MSWCGPEKAPLDTTKSPMNRNGFGWEQPPGRWADLTPPGRELEFLPSLTEKSPWPFFQWAGEAKIEVPTSALYSVMFPQGGQGEIGGF